MERLWCLLGVVLLALIGGALVAVLVLRPWDANTGHQRYPRAAVAANGYECASVGRISKLPLWSVCMAGSQLDIGAGALWRVGVMLAVTLDFATSASILKPVLELERYPHAGVAANGIECASVGRAILQKNGSAVDAAIATLFCEGIACAQCMGLGGGFLATIYDASTGQVRVLNARERAPAATTENMFENASSTIGGLAIAVPGELRGYGALYREYGRLPWRDLVKPTADLCHSGHQVNSYMAREVWHEGNIIVEPTLARTLDIIAEEGPEAIHNGSLTAQLVRDIREFGGIITEDDLRNYKVEWQEPISVQLDDEHKLYANPLPGSGSVLAFMLNMLRGYVGTPEAPQGSDLYWHRVRNMSNPAWAEEFRHLVDDARTYNDWRHYGALYEGADDHGTAHAVVVAPDGSVVSITSTINYIWGCQRRSKSLGIMLNNEMDDFAIPNTSSSYGLPPSPANMLAPGYNPLSSMVPSIVLNRDGDAVLVAGGAGGTKITTQVALVVRNVILEGQSLPDSMSRPRLHHQLLPMEVQYEEDFDAVTILYSSNESR
ncbi:Gamma-glutamyl transpeptidase [Operophtera brumata]|uniref:Gamma-glutamyl transpeptidase n=1 Tax=Operophtera brumata TaxID=104452 RepID=A0A0L7LCA7_OPEBR|nr:Gamma-glutamyl transpeptidase [Operophtera brumata]